jgi:hypothetical protein
LFCNWSAVDFAHEKVRAHMRKFVRELVDNYDVDGIEYDFNRHAQLFKSVAMGGEASQPELDLMTAFMGELRAITEEAGHRKGRPIIVDARAGLGRLLQGHRHRSCALVRREACGHLDRRRILLS